jgi:hypothetical protein
MIQNYKDKDWLIEQYCINKLSFAKIGELANVTGPCIKYWLRKHNIKTRAKFYHLKELNQNKDHQSKAGKARSKWTNDHYSHLASKRMKQKNPGGLMHIKFKERNPKGYYEHQRKASEQSALKNTNWEFYNKYGMLSSQYPYPDEFNRKLKERIFNRDGGLCRGCFKLIFNGHAIHHIDYNKDNNNEENLILLCPSCHSKTGTNRKHWKSFFNKL